MPASITVIGTGIGMGACGTAAFAEVAIRLAASPVPGITIHLVERHDDSGPGPGPGLGLAFGTDQPGHLLDTGSRLMGLYAHETGDFRRWLGERRPLDPDGVEHAPRAEYCQYIRHVLDAAMAQSSPRCPACYRCCW